MYLRPIIAKINTSTHALNGQAWEEKYGKSLDFGVSAAQGLRDEMEDVAAVVPKGRNGFFFAGELATLRGRVNHDIMTPASLPDAKTAWLHVIEEVV